MFAVLKTGGKQYKVAKDDVFQVERLAANPGDTVQFNDVLMLGGDAPKLGTPFVSGAAVQAMIVDQIRGKKTISLKKRRRKHSSQRRKGHRQHLTVIRITDILASGAESTGVAAAVGGLGDAEAAPAAKPAPKKKAEAPKPAAAPAEAPAVEAVAPTNLLTEPKGTPDDLKKITGVGPKLEKTLNETGIYHFWQIAEWGPAEIAHIDELLSFKGRIERDDWIAQAKTYAAETPAETE